MAANGNGNEGGKVWASRALRALKIKQIFEENVEDREPGTVEWLQLFRNVISLHVPHVFVAFMPRRGGKGVQNALNGSIVRLARLNAWMATIVTSLTERHEGGHRPKLYEDTYRRTVRGPMNQLIGSLRVSVEY